MNDLLVSTKNICRIFNIHPTKSKGQNFLINSEVYETLIKTADLTKDDLVIEVGPGLGFLTARLAEKVRQVTAIELDNNLVHVLQTALESQDVNNIEIVNKNILEFNFNHFVRYKIVANLPYNITSIFLRQVLSLINPPQIMVLMLQKEVVERIMAHDKLNLLAISIRLNCQVEFVCEVKANNFWPQPKVDSAIIKIIPGKKIFDDSQEEKMFWRLLKVGFSSKRKMLKNNLNSSLKIDVQVIKKTLEELKLDINIRAEKLTIENWHDLFAKLYKFMI